MVAVEQVARCRCDRYPGHECPAEITQEDLLCDACRGNVVGIGGEGTVVNLVTGCGRLLANGEPVAWHVGPGPVRGAR